MAALAATGVSAKDRPVRAFVSVEPFELRLEALVKAEAWQGEWSLDPALDPANQAALLTRWEELLEGGATVSVGGRELAFPERSLRFVRYEADRGYVPDLRESIPLSEALVGITFSVPARGVEAFDLEWRWWAPGGEQVVVEVASRGKPSARILDASHPRMSWRLEGARVELPTLLPVPPVGRVASHPLRPLLGAAALLMGVALAAAFRQRGRTPVWVGWLFFGGLALGWVAWRHERLEPTLPDRTAGEELVYALLRNTYHAFDFREEAAIYDTLAESVTGPLLERIYLEIRASLELESEGGPRVRVHEVALRACDPAVRQGEGFATRAEWVTVGEVTHWGHTHERTNRYEAAFALQPADGVWKIGDLKLLNEERMQKVSRSSAAEVEDAVRSATPESSVTPATPGRSGSNSTLTAPPP